MGRVYDSSRWAEARARALARDGDRCVPAFLLGGECGGVLDVHHIVRPEHGGDPYDPANLITVCHRHHPALERVRRIVQRERLRRDGWRACGHHHRYRSGREACERRLNNAA